LVVAAATKDGGIEVATERRWGSSRGRVVVEVGSSRGGRPLVGWCDTWRGSEG
jgi:hypothetical protein